MVEIGAERNEVVMVTIAVDDADRCHADEWLVMPIVMFLKNVHKLSLRMVLPY